MAEQNEEGLVQVDVPQPPRSPNNQVYYFIYGEYTQVIQESTIASPENPNPTGQMFSRIVGFNESIAMHPAVYSVLIQDARPGYRVKWAVGMSKELYDWYKDVEKRTNEAFQKAQEKKPDV